LRTETHSHEIEVRIQGHPEKLYVDVGKWSCGSIKDGVSFKFGNEAFWVMSYTELWRLAALAREERKRNDTR